ncbi:alpha amylase N-terminal ig-like domain-containing protein [Ligilactobacillus equi]
MNYPAIYHRPESEMAYLLDSKTIQIRLKAAKNDLKQVQILAGDPYALNNPHFKRPHLHTQRPNR